MAGEGGCVSTDAKATVDPFVILFCEASTAASTFLTAGVPLAWEPHAESAGGLTGADV